MDIKSTLREELQAFVQYKNVEPCYKVFNVSNLHYLQLRDGLTALGEIMEENQEEQLYVSVIRSGFFSKNPAAVSTVLDGSKLHVMAYAKEGLIDQHTSNLAFKEIESWLKAKGFLIEDGETADGENNNKNSRMIFKRKPRVFQLLVLALIIGIVGTVYAYKDYYSSVEKYNDVCQEYNSLAVEYNELSKNTALYNISGLCQIAELYNEKDSSIGGFLQAMQEGTKTSEIKIDTDELEKNTETLIYDFKVAMQITNPSEKWVLDRLDSVEDITGVEAVTTNHDPNAMLGKEGGYSSCIYFTSQVIDPESVTGKDIVDKGTDAGGAIEVYRNLKDAEYRCEYLSNFDNTLLYSGSYAIIGTMVIRTSYKLSNEGQLDLTNKITEALTKVEPTA